MGRLLMGGPSKIYRIQKEHLVTLCHVPKRLRTCPRRSNGIARIVNNGPRQQPNAANGGNHGYGQRDRSSGAEHPCCIDVPRWQVVRHGRKLVAAISGTGGMVTPCQPRLT